MENGMGFRVKFETKDGIVLKNRQSTPDPFFTAWGFVDKEFVEYSLAIDSREIGVRIISYTIDKETGIHAIVEWL